jgi:hypothetical protein
VVVVVWEDFDREREGAAAEASAIADIARAAAGLREPAAGRVTADAEDYLAAVIDDEWPALAAGRAGARLEAISDRLWRELATYAPAADGDRNVQLLVLNRMAEASDHRRRRLFAAREELPAILRLLLAAGAALVIGFANFFGLRYRGSQLALNAGLAAMIGLVLFTIHALDHPFRGEIRIDPGEYRIALEVLRGRGP